MHNTHAYARSRSNLLFFSILRHASQNRFFEALLVHLSLLCPKPLQRVEPALFDAPFTFVALCAPGDFVTLSAGRASKYTCLSNNISAEGGPRTHPPDDTPMFFWLCAFALLLSAYLKGGRTKYRHSEMAWLQNVEITCAHEKWVLHAHRQAPRCPNCARYPHGAIFFFSAKRDSASCGRRTAP